MKRNTTPGMVGVYTTPGIVGVLVSLIATFAAAETNQSQNTIQVRPLQDIPGVIFIEQENVTFTSTAWHLAFSVNLSSIGMDLKRVKEIFRAARSNVSHPIDFQMMKRLEQSISMVENEYQNLIHETQQTMQVEEPRKRSLNPIDWIGGSLGSIARELFGIASAEDVSRINSYVDVLLQKDNKISSLQSLHITAVRDLEGQIQGQKDQLAALVNLTGTLFETLMPEVEDRQILSSTVLFLHGELASTLTTFRDTVQNLLRMMELLNRGYVSPDILPIKDLHQTLEHIKSQIPKDMEIVYDNEGSQKQELYPYYHNRLASLLPGKQDIRGVLQIPIANKRNKFKVYKVFTFPSRQENDRTGHRFRWSGTETFVALTPEQDKYAELGPWFDDKRCLPGPPMICPAHMGFSTDPNSQCLYQLITGKMDPSKSQCKFESVNKDIIVVRAINEVEWVISTNQELVVKPSCVDTENPNWPIQRMDGSTILGEVIVTVPRHCMAMIGRYIIPLRLRITNGIPEVKNRIKTVEFSMKDLATVHEKTSQENRLRNTFFEAYQQVMEMKKKANDTNKDTNEVYEIISKMTNIKEEMDKLKPVWVTHYMSFGGWVIFTVLIIVTIALVYRFRNQIMSCTDGSSMVPNHEISMIQMVPVRSPRTSWNTSTPLRSRSMEVEQDDKLV